MISEGSSRRPRKHFHPGHNPEFATIRLLPQVPLAVGMQGGHVLGSDHHGPGDRTELGIRLGVDIGAVRHAAPAPAVPGQGLGLLTAQRGLSAPAVHAAVVVAGAVAQLVRLGHGLERRPHR